MFAYALLVGIPVLGLLGILEVGRGLAAPPALSGEWRLQLADDNCAGSHTLAMAISQSGIGALITINDRRAMTFPATITGDAVHSDILTAAISGKRGERILQGTVALPGCPPLAFQGIRQVKGR